MMRFFPACILTAFTVLLIAHSSAAQTDPPADFAWLFQGVGDNHVWNTFEETFTYAGDSSAQTVPMRVSNRDKAAIYQKLMEADFFDFPPVLEQVSASGKLALTAQSTAVYLMVRVNGQIKEVECPSLYSRYPRRAEFLEVVDLLRGTLKEQKAYRKIARQAAI